MKKDKEWLKDEVKSLFDKACDLGKMEYHESEESIDRINSLIDQLDEPQKPVIPQFVAEWIEESREEGFTLFGVFHFSKGKVNSWIYEGGYKDERANIVARAWLDGYEVEKEKRYRLVFPHTHNELDYAYLRKDGGFCHSNMLEYADTFTEAEIKAIDERYWAFAEEVTE